MLDSLLIAIAVSIAPTLDTAPECSDTKPCVKELCLDGRCRSICNSAAPCKAGHACTSLGGPRSVAVCVPIRSDEEAEKIALREPEVLPSGWFLDYGPERSTELFLSCRPAASGGCDYSVVEVIKVQPGVCRIASAEKRAEFPIKRVRPWTWTWKRPSVDCGNVADVWTLFRKANGSWGLTYRQTKLRPPVNDGERACASVRDQDFTYMVEAPRGFQMGCDTIVFGPT
jgi:hypothetical protein